MSAWLALLDPAADLTAPGDPAPGDPAPDLTAAAGDHLLVAWLDADRRPHPSARRVAPDVLDARGAPARLSLLWPDRGALPLFDDPAVVEARRGARRLPAPRAVSTLTVDSRHFAGSLWVTDDARGLDDDPFRILGHPLRLRVAAGILGRSAPLVGPAQERYSGAPWPSGSFGRGPGADRPGADQLSAGSASGSG